MGRAYRSGGGRAVRPRRAVERRIARQAAHNLRTFGVGSALGDIAHRDARTPTSISDTMRLHFDPTWVYMHRGYPLPAYRGRRLHAVAMSWALRRYTSRGARGLISYVDFNSFPSLRSVERLGYRIFGEVVVFALGGREFAVSTPGCRPYGFRVLPSAA
jgi:hypothetical protein